MREDSSSSLAAIAAIAIAALTLFAAGVVWAIVALVVSAVVLAATIGRGKTAELNQRYQDSYATWDKKFMCLQCGAEMLATADGKLQNLVGEPIDPVFDSLIRSGSRPQAVKHYGERHGVSLSAAKGALDRRQRELLG